MKNMLLAIIRYRGFIISSVKRDFQLRYQRSMLGGLWLILQPLSLIMVYTFIFANIMKAKLPGIDGTFAYSIYLCAGLLTWGLFTEILNRSITIFVENSNLLKKLNFPRICLPVIVIISSIINFAIIFSLFTIFLLVTSNFPGWIYLNIFPVLLILLIFVIGLGLILGVLNVFFRDIAQLFGIITQFWFWLTPIVYPVTILPEWAPKYLHINPMLSIIESMQEIFIQHQFPNYSSLTYPLILGLILLMLGGYLFRKHSGEIVDEL